MERQKHSFAVLFDSLVKYAIDHMIFVRRTNEGNSELTFSICYSDLHCILNICKSTLDVDSLNIDFHLDTCVCKVIYSPNLPF